MKDEIEQYSPAEPSVVAVGDQRVRAWVGDEHPHLGSVLWVGNTPTRVVTLAGAHRVEAITFDTSAISIGDPVRCDPDLAGWPAARRGRTPLDSLGFEPGRSVVAQASGADVTSLDASITVLDEILPIARHGVTLILDTGADDAVTDRIYGAIDGEIACVSTRPVPQATHQVEGRDGLALGVAHAWARELGGALIIEALPFDLDELLASDRGITTLVRVHVRDGLDILAETLDLGHCDTQILLRPDGTIDLSRSTSSLRPDAAWSARLARVAELRQQVEIFGAHDLEPDDVELLREVDVLERGLLDEE